MGYFTTSVAITLRIWSGLRGWLIGMCMFDSFNSTGHYHAERGNKERR